MKKVLFGFILAFCMSLGMLYVFTQFTKPETRIVSKNGFVETNAERVDLSSIIISQVSEKQKLICLEVDAEQNLDISKAFLDLDIFRKTKNITFYGKGTYTLDLSKLNSASIVVDKKKKTVDVNIERPILESVNIDETLTNIQQTENGLFSFGEYKLTPEEYNDLIVQVNEKLREKMSAPEITDKAYESAEKNMTALISNILSSENEENYSIMINYIS